MKTEYRSETYDCTENEETQSLNAKFAFYASFFLVLEGLSVKYKHRECERKCEIQECMHEIYREKWRCEHDRRSDDGLDIQCLKVREYDHEKFTEIEEYLIARMDRHIGHGRDGMTDHIYPHDEQYGKDRGDERGEKQYDGKKKKELQINKPNRSK